MTKIKPQSTKFIKFVHHYVDGQKYSSFCRLLAKFKRKYSQLSGEGDAYKRGKFKSLTERMWVDLKDELYNTADICDHTLWKWEDAVDDFDEKYLLAYDHTSPRPWAELVDSWLNPNWVYSVLDLVRDFNLDNQPGEYLSAFYWDFKRCECERDFVSKIYKWTDLIVWSPWKLSLLMDQLPQPQNSHYDDEFNPELQDSDDILD